MEENLEENPHTEKQEESAKKNEEPGDWKTIEEDPTKINIDGNIGSLAGGFIDFIKSTLSLRHGKYDFEQVVAAAKENVVFKGYNVWILICSIIIASIGLNMDSVAVIIGAMLISPLMGPIRGIGFGVGMNDFPLLISSVKNFGVMVGISLVTSVIYFAISPIDVENSQLLGRTEPNFLDAMIAFFGGLAGIIAASNGKNDTVINGVAIATALMPPLCTAGWGIANGEWAYIAGASYLFLLNSLFICLSTIVLIRYLHFPKREYVSDRIERRVQNYIILFLVLILIPSGYLFYRMTKKSMFESNAALFVEQVVKKTEDNLMVSSNPIFSMDTTILELSFLNTYIDSTTVDTWNRQKETYGLEDAGLKIIQGDDFNVIADRKIKDALGLSRNQNELVNLLKEKELRIENMQTEFRQLEESSGHKLDMDYILRGFKQEYSEIKKIAINKSFGVDDKNQMDTSYVITVRFQPDIPVEKQNDVKSKINRRFCFELKEKVKIDLDSVKVINF